MKRTSTSFLALAFFLALQAPGISSLAATLDSLRFGNAGAEAAHQLTADHSDILPGALGQPARHLLSRSDADWQGGTITFTMKVDPEKPNYLTIKLWGSDINPNHLQLFIDGKQVGYRYLGDIDALDIGSDEPFCNGRFFYNTSPLPIAITRGKQQLQMEIRSSGPVWGYADRFDQFQKKMMTPTRGLYAVYSHTDTCFMPLVDDPQGAAPADPPPASSPGPEVLTQLKNRLNGELNKLLASTQPLNQTQLEFLGQAYHVSWCAAYHNPTVVTQILHGADDISRDFASKSRTATKSGGSPDWIGLGPLGDALRQVAGELQTHLSQQIDIPGGEQQSRKALYAAMLADSRDIHRRNRRMYTNQTMINDLYGIYLSNRGIQAVDPAAAFPEEQVRRYLYESTGLQPWLGSDPGGEYPAETHGRPWGVARDYMEFTAKGLSRELGYVGNYGEVLDWGTHIYNATCDPGKPDTGDPRIRAQLVKMEAARAVFRYPALDVQGRRAMRMEAVIGWRDVHYPGEVVYGERAAGEGSPLYSVAATLDAHSIGFAQQMFADGQFFPSIERLLKGTRTSLSLTLLHVPDQYALLETQSASPCRLPMTPSQPDFVFADPEDGVVAVKYRDEILYASLYWRARYAVNNLARIHHITPAFDRIATVHEEARFDSSGRVYTRPNWTAFGYGNGGPVYPDNPQSADAGEQLSIARIPDSVKFKPGDESPYAGKASFYQLRFGNYLIAMNCSRDQTFQSLLPDAFANARDCATGATLAGSTALSIPPLVTRVLHIEDLPSSPP